MRSGARLGKRRAAHFQRHPETRPTLAELAMVAAELDGHPLAGHDELLATAAAELAELQPDATGSDVLIYAMGMRSKSGATA